MIQVTHLRGRVSQVIDGALEAGGIGAEQSLDLWQERTSDMKKGGTDDRSINKDQKLAEMTGVRMGGAKIDQKMIWNGGAGAEKCE